MLRTFIRILGWRGAVAGAAVSIVTGCGTYVPDHQEAIQTDPDKRRAAALLLESAIVQSVTCELRNAVIEVVGNNPRHAEFAHDWAVQVALTLTIDESTTVSPNILMSFLPSLFTLLFGGSVSTEATRVDTFNFYYPVDTLLGQPKCDENFAMNFPHGSGSLLIRSDLRTADWLYSVLQNRLVVDGEDRKNGLQHKITFVVDTTGNITPGAVLPQVTLMPSGTFLSVGRKRTHDLQLTFGPADPEQKKEKVLSPNAQSLHQVGQFASALQGANVRLVRTP